MSEDSFTPVSETGEFGLIDRIDEMLGVPADESVLRTIGDDAAVYKVGDGKVHVVTTDALIENIHFDRSFMPMEYLGVKVMAVNVSDVVAMNARPKYATIALGLPHDVSVEMVELIYVGIRNACKAYNMSLIGGDTTAAQRMTISVTVIGEADEDDVVYRNGAHIDDIVCVTGDLGASYAGLRVLIGKRNITKGNGAEHIEGLDDFRYVIQRHLTPTPRLTVLNTMAEAGVRPTSMIDISDGLASEIQHLCRQSHCGALLRAADLPIHEETRKLAGQFSQDADTYALYGGEDYELLMTLRPDGYEKLPEGTVTAIGTITDIEDILIETPEGSRIPIKGKGYQHFGGPSEV